MKRLEEMRKIRDDIRSPVALWSNRTLEDSVGNSDDTDEDTLRMSSYYCQWQTPK